MGKFKLENRLLLMDSFRCWGLNCINLNFVYEIRELEFIFIIFGGKKKEGFKVFYLYCIVGDISVCMYMNVYILKSDI